MWQRTVGELELNRIETQYVGGVVVGGDGGGVIDNGGVYAMRLGIGTKEW